MLVRYTRFLLCFALVCVVTSVSAQEAGSRDNEGNIAKPSIESDEGILQRASNTAQAIATDATDTANGLISKGLGFLGIRYKYGGTTEKTGFDCSGLVTRVFRDALGLNLPRTAKQMASMGEKINKEDLKPGDLVFFNTMRKKFSHVGIYLGEDKFLHAPSKGGRVRIENIDARYWAKRFNGGRRLVQEDQDGSTASEIPGSSISNHYYGLR